MAFAIIIVISTIQWFVDGRKNFTGPRVDMGLEVLEAVQGQQTSVDSDRGKKELEEDAHM